MLTIKHIFLVLGMGLSLPFWGQKDAQTELKRIITSYRNLESCSLRVKTSLFAKSTDSEPKRVMMADTRLSPTGSIVRVDAVEVLTNQQCVLVIDNQQRVIQYSKSSFRELQDELQKQKKGLTVGDSLFQATHQITLTLNESGKLKMEAEPLKTSKGPERSLYEFDTQKGHLTSVTYYYGAGSTYQKVVMVYEYTDLSPSFSSLTFSESAYLNGTGPKASPKGVFKEYTYYNLYEKTLNDYLKDEE